MKSGLQRYGNWMAFGIFAILSFTGVWFHEPWRDEAQAWLLARDLSFPALIREMGYDGSPALWHLLLMVPAKAGLPYFSMQVLHWMIALGSAWLLIFRSPFERLFRYLLVFNYYLVYEYVVIARSYALSVLLIFLLAHLFRKRGERPWLYSLLIVLLLNTNTHSLFPAIAIALVFLYDLYRKEKTGFKNFRFFGSLIILGLGGAAFLFQMIPPADSWKPGLMNGSDWPWIFDAIGHSLIPNYLSNPGMTLHFKHWTELSFLCLCFILILYWIRQDRRMLFIYLFSIGGLSLIFTFKHSGYLRHFGFLQLMLIFVLWAGKYPELHLSLTDRIKQVDKKKVYGLMVYVLIGIFLLNSVITGLYSLGLDYRKSFSGAKEMAGIIRDQYPGDERILCYNIHTITALVPYLPERRFWDAGLEKEFSFIHWGNDYLPSRTLDQTEIYRRLLLEKERSRASLVVLPYPAVDSIMPMLMPLYQADKNITGDEKYYLYRIKP